ncbi:MAG TPA: glucoamylase family protein [Elusimicrobiota bacterium]|nr:glucoamylase family protein [Elusimicrobiota bacterium]
MSRLLALLLIGAPLALAATNEQAASAASARFDGGKSSGSADRVSAPPAPPAPPAKPLSKSDDAFIEDLSRRSFRFFWEQADAKTGLVADRAGADGKAPRMTGTSHVASAASTGFGLSALCAAADRGWIAPKEARERARLTLRFLKDSAPQEHGFFYHFIDSRTGARVWNSEVSSIDTALLLTGALTAKQCFSDDPEISSLAAALYERVDFPWMMQGEPPLLSMGWTPERGFIPARWDSYSEHMMLDLLAIGSPTHPISPEEWDRWRRDYVTYSSFTYVAGDKPLFIHQYSQAYVDFRGKHDSHKIDYFENSVKATLAQRSFFMDLSKEFPTYSQDVWGLTASDSAHGYIAWGAPPRDPRIDGTVVPCAAGGSLMFTPEESIAALRAMKERYGRKVYGRYGFVDAFNPATGWTDQDVIGIDQGITLLSAENLRGGKVWSWFMKNPEIGRAMKNVGFEENRP